MTRVLGLDVSTSCVGVALVDDHAVDGNIAPVLLDHVSFPSKVKTLWEKASVLRDHLNVIRRTYVIDRVVIEDAAKKFTRGASSATTIATLMRFNGMATYVAYVTFGYDPEYVAPTTARKAIGLRMQQRKKCGKSHKEQTFDAMMASDLRGRVWPTKRNGVSVVDWAYDAVDAYVVAKAGLLMNK